MRTKGAVIAAVCLFVAAFGGGAVTAAQLDDAETATVSATAGNFDVCEDGETVRYEFSRESDELKHVSGPDIITFSNYDYRRGWSGPVAVDTVDFEATEPVRQVRYRVRYGGTRTERFRSPAIRGRLGSSGWFSRPFVALTLTCADGDGGEARSVSVERSDSAANSPNASVAVAQSSSESDVTKETSAPTTENETERSENDSSTASEPTSVTEPAENTTGKSTATPTQTETQTAATTETSTATDASTTTSSKAATETQPESTETASSTDTTEPTTRVPSTTETNETLSDVSEKRLFKVSSRD